MQPMCELKCSIVLIYVSHFRCVPFIREMLIHSIECNSYCEEKKTKHLKIIWWESNCWKRVTNPLTKLDELRCNISDIYISLTKSLLHRKWLFQAFTWSSHSFLHYTIDNGLQDATNSFPFTIFYRYLFLTHSKTIKRIHVTNRWVLVIKYALLDWNVKKCCVHHSRSISVFR